MTAHQEQDEEKRPWLAVRVYTIRDGRLTEDRGTIHVTAGERPDSYALANSWPPCQCPRHREPSDPEHPR